MNFIQSLESAFNKCIMAVERHMKHIISGYVLILVVTLLPWGTEPTRLRQEKIEELTMPQITNCEHSYFESAEMVPTEIKKYLSSCAICGSNYTTGSDLIPILYVALKPRPFDFLQFYCRNSCHQNDMPLVPATTTNIDTIDTEQWECNTCIVCHRKLLTPYSAATLIIPANWWVVTIDRTAYVAAVLPFLIALAANFIIVTIKFLYWLYALKQLICTHKSKDI